MKSLDLYIKESLDIKEALRLKKGDKISLVDINVVLFKNHESPKETKGTIDGEYIIWISNDANEIRKKLPLLCDKYDGMLHAWYLTHVDKDNKYHTSPVNKFNIRYQGKSLDAVTNNYRSYLTASSLFKDLFNGGRNLYLAVTQ